MSATRSKPSKQKETLATKHLEFLQQSKDEVAKAIAQAREALGAADVMLEKIMDEMKELV